MVPIKIFLLNAPPRAGKDTAADYLSSRYRGKVRKFAAPVKRAVTAIYHGGDINDFKKYDTADLKDSPQEVYFGKTCRECQIGVSEHFLKPFHNDPSIFGKILAQQLIREFQEIPVIYFISDSGFRREAEILVEKFSPENVYLFKIFRDNYTFVGDSRSYITLKDAGVREFDIQNIEGNSDIMFGSMASIINSLIGVDE